MLDRADSLGIQSLPSSRPTAFPAWVRALEAPETEAEAAFLAGAALSRLDAVVRDNPPWAGVFRQAPGAERRRRQCCPRRPDRGRGGLARRLPPRPAGRRSGAGGEAFARLAGFVRPLGGAVAFVFPRRRRRLGGPARRGAAGGGRSRRGVRRRRPAGAVCRGAGFWLRPTQPDAERRARIGWGQGRGGRAARGLARRRRAGAAPQMAVRTALARRAAVFGRRSRYRRRRGDDPRPLRLR